MYRKIRRLKEEEDDENVTLYRQLSSLIFRTKKTLLNFKKTCKLNIKERKNISF